MSFFINDRSTIVIKKGRKLSEDVIHLRACRGLGATLLQVTPSLAINYTAYGTLRSYWLQRHGGTSPHGARPRPAPFPGLRLCHHCRSLLIPAGRVIASLGM